MAKAAALPAPQEGAPSKGPSLVVQLAVLLVLTLVAAGAGYFSGGMLKGETAPEESAAAAEAGHGAKKEGDHGASAPEDPAAADLKRGIYNLPAITTNLAAPTDTWIRVELAGVFEGEADPTVADAVHQDILAYLRTVKLHQVEGASGFLHLKDDMDERARIRSEGKMTSVLIRTIVFE
ncbi:flagellar basal body-associated FliL family protein [Mesorhizobium sp. J428]|uniref:flagellar basal body-associated FliL family protein n=1 Tax=Mesorhizobium sp. J428 TaxID=2898440 RepID=UPI002151585C|nr:flagellar basal body-associated FliL family protein [Mesorhizobium sp. J428]MCR5855859.1 flagellar basal body-associated FliL family protein [Mesorhizobium sp. J428]